MRFINLSILALRWHVISPTGERPNSLQRGSSKRPQTYNSTTGVPHFSDDDDIYDGYLIPKGSVVIGNA